VVKGKIELNTLLSFKINELLTKNIYSLLKLYDLKIKKLTYVTKKINQILLYKNNYEV
jgi:hypothetical protein